MCGAYGFSVKDAKEVYKRFDIANSLDDFTPRYNIRPGQMNPVITQNSKKYIERMFWGIIPFFTKDYSHKYKTMNARVETVMELPTYSKLFRKQRCLVPATGFFEWDKTQKPSVPYYFYLKNDPIFAFAGLYDSWVDPKTNQEIHSYTIITTKANQVVGKVHPRMPVILHREDEKKWLSPTQIAQELLALLTPYPNDEMQEYMVDTAVNSPRNDNPEIIKPLDATALL